LGTEVLVERAAMLADALAARLASAAAAHVPAGGTLTLALAGGSLATTCFPRLAALPLDWSRVGFFWADERAVAPDHPDSNYRLAHELWLAPARVPATSVHRMPADAPDLDAAADRYAHELSSHVGDPARLGAALLGVGEDGHVASLFPDHALLDEKRRTVAAVFDAPKPPPRRLTLTLPVLTSAELVVVAAFGASKRAAMTAALGDPSSALPVARLLRRARCALVLLDPAAAP
jgi:6-phosphogluconolactonase